MTQSNAFITLANSSHIFILQIHRICNMFILLVFSKELFHLYSFSRDRSSSQCNNRRGVPKWSVVDCAGDDNPAIFLENTKTGSGYSHHHTIFLHHIADVCHEYFVRDLVNSCLSTLTVNNILYAEVRWIKLTRTAWYFPVGVLPWKCSMVISL